MGVHQLKHQDKNINFHPNLATLSTTILCHTHTCEPAQRHPTTHCSKVALTLEVWTDAMLVWFVTGNTNYKDMVAPHSTLFRQIYNTYFFLIHHLKYGVS